MRSRIRLILGRPSRVWHVLVGALVALVLGVAIGAAGSQSEVDDIETQLADAQKQLGEARRNAESSAADAFSKTSELEAARRQLSVVTSTSPPATGATRPTTSTTQLSGEGTRSNPIPLGKTRRVADWELTVLESTPDAAAPVAARNQFNKPPAAGNQFFMTRLKVTYVGASSKSFSAGIFLAALGRSGRTYQSFSDSCGVIPDDLPGNELFTGGSVEGNWCVSVHADDAEGLLLLFGGEYVGGVRTFFALT